MNEVPLYVAVVERTTGRFYKGWRMNIETKEKEPIRVTTLELKSIIDPTLCDNQVNYVYINERISRTDVIIFLYYEVPEEARLRIRIKKVPVAFIMADSYGDELYIDVICSSSNIPELNRHSGGLLINTAIDYAKEKQYEQVTLSALPHVLTYYPRFGFSHRRGCDSPTDVEIPERLKQRIKDRTLPKTSEEAYYDDDMLDYMSELQLKQYGNMYNDGCNEKNPVLMKKNMKDYQCADNGFKMRYCFGK
jgi:hypothetical protein